MIDTHAETLLTLSDVTKLLPTRRGGKRVHISCVYRWTVTGCRGVVLDSTQIGATRCTSHEALARFFERLTADRTGAPVPTRTPRQQQRDIAQAVKELDDAGI
jgi:uncharacterized protein DUF1580